MENLVIIGSGPAAHTAAIYAAEQASILLCLNDLWQVALLLGDNLPLQVW